MMDRRTFVQAAAGSLLLPFGPSFTPGLAYGQVNRTLSVERRPPAEQARAEANLNGAPRQALVIGNSRYTGVTPLKNPANDAQAIAAQLKNAGFQVQLRQDLGREAMIDAIEAYSSRLASTKSVGLFYFAGHGLQLSWRNFLVPVDAQLASPEDIPSRCVDLSGLMGGITRAGNPMNVVVLDACRDNPFGNLKLEHKGLSQFDAPGGTLLAYATSPGNVASDGEGQNGLYTQNLMRELQVPEAKIEDVFKRVRLGVRRGSNGQQIPWETTSLEEDFYFLPPKQFRPVAQSEANRQFEVEVAAWEKVKASKEAAALEDFLRRYPSGRFSELAQLRLDQVLAALGEKKIRAETAPNPFSQGAGVTDTRYTLGDSYTYRMIDFISKVEGSRFTRTVIQVSEDQVHYSNGEISDLLGNPLIDYFGIQSQVAQQVFPTEYQVGKRWSTRFRYVVRGEPGSGSQEFVVVGRERITVPAGTFDTFRIEGRTSGVHNGQGRSGERRFWVAPGTVRQPIAQEDIRRAGPKIARADRLELVSFKQS